MIKLLLLAALSWAAPFAPSVEGNFISGEFCGLNNTDAPASIPDCAAQSSINFESNREGNALVKRRGYTRQGTLPISTGVVSGAHRFITDAGDDLVIACSDTACAKSTNRGAFAIFLGTATSGVRFWSWVSVDGDAYGANSKRDKVAVYDGTTLTYSNSIPQAKLLALLPDRLVAANTSAAPNRVSYSKSGDFDNFTTGPEDVDSFFDDLGAAGEEITYLGTWLGDLVIGKSKSIMLCEVGDQYTTRCSPLTETIGVSDPGAITQAGEDLYVSAADGTYWKLSRRTGMKPISVNIEAFITGKAAGSLKSNTQSTQADWDAGLDNPDGSFDTRIEIGAIANSSATFTNTSSSSFAAGTLDGVSITDVVGSVTLSSTVVQDNFSDGNFTSNREWVVVDGSWDIQSGALHPTEGGSGQHINAIQTSTVTLSSGSWSWTYKFTAPGTTSCSGTSPGGTCFDFRFLQNEGGDFYAWRTIDAVDPTPKTIRAIKSIGGVETVLSGSTQTVSTGVTYEYTVERATTGVTSFLIDGVWISSFSDTAISSGSVLYIWASVSGSPLVPDHYFDDIYAFHYNSPATFTSEAFNTNFPTPIGGPFSSTFTAAGLSSGYGIFFDVRASADGSAWSDWVATSDTLRVGTTEQYIQWRARFSTDYSSYTPRLDSVQIPVASTGTYRVRCIEPGSGITAFGALSCAESNTGNGDFVFYTTSAISCAALPSTTPDNWDAHTNNATVSSPANAAMYYGFRSLLGSATDQAKIEACQLYWTEGTAAQPTWAVYDPVENSVFWTAQTSGSATADRLLKYDIDLSGQFEVFWPHGLSVGPMLYYDNHIHFGSSNGGYWNKYAQSGIKSDNGTAINATWKSKDYSFGAPFQEKSFKVISFLSQNNQGGTLDATWATERHDGQTFSVSLSTSSSYPYIRSNYNLLKKSDSTLFNLQFANSESDADVSILGWGVNYFIQPWRVMNP